MASVEDIKKLLHWRFRSAGVTIVDESAKHAGHAGAAAGGGTHFRLYIVSEQFIGHTRVERHRMIYTALQPLFEKGLHALTIDAKTPDEASAGL